MLFWEPECVQLGRWLGLLCLLLATEHKKMCSDTWILSFSNRCKYQREYYLS